MRLQFEYGNGFMSADLPDTTDVFIRNQTLFVRLSAPALRADLSMRRQDFVRRLNEYVGNQVIADIRFC